MAGLPPPPGGAPALQKPPGYRDPSTPAQPRLPLHSSQRRPLPPSFRPLNSRKHGRSGCTCGRCFCFCLLVFLILLCVVGLAGVVFYLYFQPKVPSVHLESLSVGKFDVVVKSDGSFLDASSSASLQFKNSNSKIKYSYESGNAKFSAVDVGGNVDVGSGKFPGLNQGTRNSTVVKVTANAKKVLVVDSVGSRLKSRYRSKELKFLVEIKTKLEVRVRDGITMTFPVKIACGDASLKKMRRKRKCTIKVLNWIKLS